MQLIALALKALFGGTLVAVFSGLGDVLKPKAFAGLFGAAPSVAAASLFVTVMTSGASRAAISSRGMIACAIIGAVGLVAFALVATFGIKPLGAITALVLAAAAWLLAAVAIYTATMAWRRSKPGPPAPRRARSRGL